MNNVITIVGTGMWGTTLAVQLAKANRAVRWLARTDGEAAQLRQWGENRRFLPGSSHPVRRPHHKRSAGGDTERAPLSCS